MTRYFDPMGKENYFSSLSVNSLYREKKVGFLEEFTSIRKIIIYTSINNYFHENKNN